MERNKSTLCDGCLAPAGIDGTTGEYLRPRLTVREVARAVREQPLRRQVRFRALRYGADARNLRHTGWGVVYAESFQAEKDALRPLLDHRRQQAGHGYREIVYEPGEDPLTFKLRQKLPYYLLIVGSPEAVPFSFQYQLDVAHAVGRVAFETPEEYARYALNAVKAEQDGKRKTGAPRIDLFGPSHDDDALSRLSAEQLVAPLASSLCESEVGWTVKPWLGKLATKNRLARLLGDEHPDLLFTAGHGLGFQSGDRRQAHRQGSLLCEGWPGPIAGRGRPVSEEHCFCGEDLAPDADLRGLVSFHFACFSAGTPRLDSFSHILGRNRKELAPKSFVAHLPQRLLKAGALAVVGHVDTAWPCSFHWKRFGNQLETFECALKDLMDGFPVGAAMESFGRRYGEIATQVVGWRESELLSENELLSELEEDTSDEDLSLAFLWLANNDAKAYTVLGDPAVRLPVRA